MMSQPALETEEKFPSDELIEEGKQVAKDLLAASVRKARSVLGMGNSKDILWTGAAAIMLGGLCFGLAALFEGLEEGN